MTNAVISASAIDLQGISRAAFELIVSAEVTSEAFEASALADLARRAIRRDDRLRL
ncbi:hypothetical protein SAMN05216337_10518 [Bradyrhizobium brasilense]|uniref:Uncharacterized protein n=1 Tax=Bradyrhizobium brasilense TaxID=1419277 RepID=A0A1G7K2K1_9BRAD|nr:hypothetical protein [Bradyrhizobium brasilense]SDF31221.1 hypothetical protein SAMN05216337_10518 [Bradyrhizobium brasilense]